MTPTRPDTALSLPALLGALAPDATLVAGPDAAEAVVLTDVTHDSMAVVPGALFACRPGQRRDGHDYAPAAVAAGAVALLVERPLDVPVAQIQVPSVAAAMGPAAAAVHGHPSRELTLLGITGTNGKTTTAYLLEAILAAAGHRTGLIGTVETRIAGEAVPGVRTTPEATDLQRLFRHMRNRGVTAAAMEVSSHGLALGRVRATRFAAALFTNLSQDHLDFHADMDDYFAAKRSLFDPAYTGLAVVNVDDASGRRLADEADVRVVTVSTGGQPADVVAADIDASADGSTFTAHVAGEAVAVRTTLPGLFNVANSLLALAAAAAVDIAPSTAAAGIAACSGVPGRMERVDAGQPFTVVVDYAHTPDSLANVLRGIRRVSDGRVTVVIGCGGDRDAGKRPLMGAVAVENTDRAIFTNDNPRSEDPQAILDAIVAGAQEVAGGNFQVQPERREAIALALDGAAPGDVVVIAGKGHEATQEIGDQFLPFDDRRVARELLTVGGRQ